MGLPEKYVEWPDEAKQKYQDVKRIAMSLHDYIDVTPQIASRVNRAIHKAQGIDTGDGKVFEWVGEKIKNEYLTQTFH